MFVAPKRHWHAGAGTPLATTMNVALLPCVTASGCGGMVMAGATTGTSTRTLSTMANVRFVSSDSEAKESQWPMKILLEVNVTFVTVAIFNPSMNHSTVLPLLLTITLRQAKPM